MSYCQIGFHDIKNISNNAAKTINGKNEPLPAYN